MRRRLNDLAFVFLITLIGSYGAAGAGDEEPGPVKPPSDLRAAVANPDVYINDSFEAVDAIAQARIYAARGEWRGAAEALQNSSNNAADRLVRVAPGYYVSLREHINEVIGDWPETGLSVYRSIYEPEIQAGIAAVRVPRSLHALLPWFDQYFCTTTAAALADEIGQLAIEAGDLATAEHVYARVLQSHPDAPVYEPQYRAMLVIIRAISGDTVGDLTDTTRQTTLRWMGRDRPVADMLGEIQEGFASLHPGASLRDWPMFGGAPGRNHRSEGQIDELGLLWRFTGFEAREEGDVDEESDPFARVYRQRARSLTIQPVVAGELVIVQRMREIVALHRNTGVAAWRFRADLPGAGGFRYVDEPAPVWDSVTVYDGRVYASLPGETVPYYSYESAGSPPELACLDAKTGRVIWRVDQHAIEEEFAETTFDTSPIVGQDRLWVVGRRRRSFGFEDCYLYRFSGADGALQQRTHLGSASTGTFGSQSPTMTVAAMHGNTIYVCTNLGSIAAVYSHTGTVRWLRLYERRQTDSTQGSNRYPGNIKPWRLNPVLWSEGRVVALPTDADNVLVLDADDGSLVRSIPTETLGHVETLLGVEGDTLCGVGREAVCFDLSTGKVLWSTPAGGPEGDELHGRGVWSVSRPSAGASQPPAGGGRLLVPTRAYLSTYSVEDGRRVDTPWEADGEGGNLVALHDQVLVAGADRVSAHVRKAQIWETLRERISAAPTDPMPALELAEVALSNNELTEAVKALRSAVKRTQLSSESPTPALGRRLSDYVLMFIASAWGGASGATPETELIEELFGYAALFAPDPPAHLAYRFRFGELFSALGQPERAVSLYQQVLRDRSLRELPWADWQPLAADRRLPMADRRLPVADRRLPVADRRLPADPDRTASESAGAYAEAQIEVLIAKHGRAVYALHEAEAQQWLSAGRAQEDEAMLKRVVETFPNSTAAPITMIARGDLLIRRGKPKEAAEQFTYAYHRCRESVDRPALLKKIADAYELAGKPEYAYRWLTKGARQYPGVRFPAASGEGRLVGFSDYRERLAHIRKRVEPSRPNVTLPLNRSYTVDLAEDASLLTPWFGDEPGSSWSRCFVRLPGGVQAIDPGRGEVVWPRAATVQGAVELLLARADQAVFATPYELFALDTTTGERRWSEGEYPVELDGVLGDWEDVDSFRTHAIQGNHLLSVTDNGQMTCLDLDTGDLLWSQVLRPEPLGIVRLGESWVVYHVVQDDRVVVCLVDAAMGTWFGAIMTDERRAVEAFFETLDGQVVLVTSQSISCLDPQTPGAKWRIGVRGHIRRTSLVPEIDALYFSEDGHRLKKISLEDGALLWESDRVVPRGEDSVVVALQGSSAIVSSGSSVSAVDAVTGLTLWQGTTPEVPRFVTRLVTQSHVVAVDVPGGFLETPSIAYFYEHRHASGLIPREGGAVQLGRFNDVRAILGADDALVIQAGSKILGWTHD